MPSDPRLKRFLEKLEKMTPGEWGNNAEAFQVMAPLRHTGGPTFGILRYYENEWDGVGVSALCTEPTRKALAPVLSALDQARQDRRNGNDVLASDSLDVALDAYAAFLATLEDSDE